MDKSEKYAPLMSVVFLGAFLATLGSTTISIAIPVLTQEFDASLDLVKWTMSGFMLAMGTVAPLTRFLGEKLSYRRLYILTLIGLLVVSVLIVFSWDIYSLIIFRVFQGIFSGILAPASVALIYQMLEPKRQANALSTWTLAAMLAPAIGPTLGGWLISYFSWQSIFVINIPTGAIALVLAFKHLPHKQVSKDKAFDLAGFMTSIAGTLPLLIAFSSISQWGIISVKFMSFILVGILFLVVFFYRESKIKDPMLDVNLFRNKVFTISIIISCVISVSIYAGAILTPVFLQTVQKLSPFDAGMILFPSSLIMALSMPFVGKAYDRVDPYKLIVAGVLVIALGTWQMGRLAMDTEKMYVTFWMTVRNLGISLSTMPAMNLGMQVVPAMLSGHASAINNWMRQAIGAFALGIFGSMLTSRTLANMELLVAEGGDAVIAYSQATVLSINEINMIAAIVMVLGVPLAFMMKSGSLSEEAVKTEEGDEAKAII